MQTVTITPAGCVQFLWTDALAELRTLGRTSIRRVSHVEATPDGQWTADLALVSGPVLGPFDLRGDALSAERDWLTRHGY